MKFISYINRSIEYLYYALFLFVPLIFAGNTSELFEFNKMWLTFGIATLIGVLWFSKMLLTKQFIFKRTILDIPILLFLISQSISTVISLDPHVSLWGYYSRWNGGLLSMISYIFLFYAFISNLAGGASGRVPDSAHSSESSRSTGGRENERQDPRTRIVRNSLIVSMISGFLVVLWALPSHFGYDPTCLIFRGNLDVSCWTADFQPRVRIFGPMGQPDWLAGYLGILLPIAGAFVINELRKTKKILNPFLIFYALSFLLFYLALLYTGSRSGIAGTILGLIFFVGIYISLNRKNLDLPAGRQSFAKNKFVPIFVGVIFLISFIVGIQLPILNRFSFSEIKNQFQKQTSKEQLQKAPDASPQAPSGIEFGGSDSLKIRRIVWRGAIDVWRANPIIGTGVETFAFAYYKYRPIEHNHLSEWNFLYNKAHNEYLNYLATTGLFGLLSYLSFIALFITLAAVNILNFKSRLKILIPLQADTNYDVKDPFLLALLASFLAILFINFFGFSVVILNIYLFLIPAFLLILLNMVRGENYQQQKEKNLSYATWTGVFSISAVGATILFFLIKFWIADTKYALGYNYNRAKEYQTAYPLLQVAVNLRKEPVFEDELSVNKAILAVGLASQNATESGQTAQTLANEALVTSNKLVTDHPNNIVFWKSRVRLLYTFSNLDRAFLPQALDAIKKTQGLAPTDASVLYNLGVLYGQNNDSKNAVEVLEKTVSYKPDYRDAQFALGLFYHDLSVNEKKAIIDPSYHQKAIDRMNYILEKINPSDQPAKESLDLWEKER